MTTPKSPRVRRTPAPWWFAALAGVPMFFGFVGAKAAQDGIEQQLTTRANQVLQGIGAADASVTFEGRDAVVDPGSIDAERVRAAVAAVPGVRTVTVGAGR